MEGGREAHCHRVGRVSAVGLAEARGIAAANRRMVAAGLNPLSERRKNEAVPDLQGSRRAVSRCTTARILAKPQASRPMDDDVRTGIPAILDLPVNRIDTEAVLSVLKPLWTTKAETASRLRGRIERVLAFAEARGWRPEGKNPAQWKNGLDAILPPRQRLQRGHHKALAYHDIPAFMQRLTALPGVSAMALRFIILTAADLVKP